MVAWAEFGFAKVSGTVTGDTKVDREKITWRKPMYLNLEVKDDIPGAKVQMNDNLSPVMVPEDFAKQNSAQATTRFQSGEL